MKKTLLLGKTLFLSFLFFSAIGSSYAQSADWVQEWELAQGQECTSIMAGRKATVDGSVITSHTCDGVSHNWISIEPAADHKRTDVQKVYYGTRWTYFRDDTTGVRFKGEIPQAPHTYAYLNTGYPCLNEKQLAIGESTFTGPKQLINKDAMFMVEELARIALQRCDNARDAVKLMGSLAERYGYADGGEILTVADKNEVWEFEIVGCGKDKIGALWVAQRVPDDHVAIVANIPRIGRLQKNNPEFFLCSNNIEEVAIENKCWDGKGEFIWWKAFNASYAEGKNFGVREWFVFNTLAPSLNLTMDMEELPFSVKPEKKIDVKDVMAFFRSTFEGTEHDMTRKVLVNVPAKDTVPAHTKVSPVANPWLTASTRDMLNTIAPGTIDFRRTLAVAWCSYSTVIQLRNWLPDAVGGICWWGADNPGESPRIPLFAGATKLPAAFDYCGQKHYNPESITWKFRRANRLATVAWQTSKPKVYESIAKIEKLGFEGLPQLEKSFKESLAKNPNSAPELLNDYTAKVYEAAAEEWKALEEFFWMKYGRGF